VEAGPAIYLRRVTVKEPSESELTRFPFTVPTIRTLGALELTSPVTFFVGENGSGKSTLLEAIAAAAGSATVGADEVASDATLREQKRLGKHLRLEWKPRTHRGFFLRAEDFFGFAKRIAKLRADMFERIAELEVEYKDRSAWAKGLAMGPAAGSIAEMERRYGVDLDAQSHGQSFLALFRSRFVPGGLYLLDEPEAPLSPQSQLTLIAMLMEMTRQESQFIIATHSPILLAYPGAGIYSFDGGKVEVTSYESLEPVNLVRSYLNDPQQYLRHLTD
jgi:predicted ATPase